MCIYVLIDPRDKSKKYVGLTTRGFSRIRSHYLVETNENTRKVNWIKKLKSLGLIFDVEYLEYCSSFEDLKLAEIKWIKHFRNNGVDLLNHSIGGDGSTGRKLTEEQRREMSVRLKKSHNTPEMRKKLSESHKGLPSNRKGKKYTPEQLITITKSNQLTSGKKVIDQNGVIYPSLQMCSKILKVTMNTVKNRVYKNPDKPLKGLLLRLYHGQ
jgi:group I intron endonuclease